MKQIEKYFGIALASLFAFILISCANIQLHDDPWCADAGQEGAECFFMFSNKEFSLDKYQWDKLRAGQICTATPNPGEGYKNIANSLLKLCADTNRCTQEQISQILDTQYRIEGAQLRALQK